MGMRVDIETMVRSFVQPQIAPRPSAQNIEAAPDDGLVHVHIGSKGGKFFQWHQNDHWSITITLPDDSKFFEVTRVSQTVRVKNPQDENQFVDVDQVKHIEVVNRSGQIQTYDFKIRTT